MKDLTCQCHICRRWRPDHLISVYEQFRYSTLEEARAGHQAVVEAVEKGEIGE
jgi:hypothetical protein